MNSTYPGLPSYVRTASGVNLDFQNLAYEHLAKGDVQREARQFLLWVMEHHGIDDLDATFENLRKADPKFGQMVPKMQIEGRFLASTLALALLDELTPFIPLLNLDDHSLVTTKLEMWAPAVEMDIVELFKGKGDLSLDQFCELYSVEPSDLALKVILEDDAQAFQAFSVEGSHYLETQMSLVPYNPLSAIRPLIAQNEGVISRDEMRMRFHNQLSVFHSHEAPINAQKPSKLIPGKRISFTELDVTDHKLRIFPDYLPMLREEAQYLVLEFSQATALDIELTPEQNAMVIQIMDDFELAGVSRADFLMFGIGKGGFLSDERYLAKTPELRDAMYPRALVNLAAIIGDSASCPSTHNKLFQINRLINKEPVEVLESKCQDPCDWHALYRATHDSKYLKHLSTRIERVFSADLGL